MEKFKTALKNKNFDHLYFFIGEETFLSDYYLDALKTALKCNTDFDYTVLDSENISELQEAVEGMPMMSEKKLVVVKGIELSNEIEKDDVDYVEEILNIVPSFTCLVFSCRTIKKTSKLYKILKDKCTQVEFDFQKPQDVTRWVLKACQAKNVVIDRETAAYLVDCAGVDMTLLGTEIDKLSSYCGDEPVTIDAIDKIVIKSMDAKTYQLMDAVFDGHSKEAFELLNELSVAESGMPIYLNASLMGNIRTLLEYEALVSEGKSNAAISDRLRLYPAKVKKYSGYIKKMDKKFLQNMLKRCIEIDAQMKMGADGLTGLSLVIGEMLTKTKK